jgi:hypothetical protein
MGLAVLRLSGRKCWPFISNDFILVTLPDIAITPVSRTVGDHRLVDKMIFSLQRKKF